ncbi:spermidine/putrescine ABC transporter substrate-binding protein [Acrocarpospora phusangensis]|uniref:Spermidine/putrescine ABC transporter substrate-binding protein n=1 Tax=Acrocarpospora phusangensis TaxID=1070424 RepID=A0A919UVI8_9ACTN|nr:extracellular solute-binding protein [Acrocarpospora phusangensis]GIH29450.1 spermidine/putrescine ABC transporter substrate-binding protein [Acrocarpospora phusangensis]
MRIARLMVAAVLLATGCGQAGTASAPISARPSSSLSPSPTPTPSPTPSLSPSLSPSPSPVGTGEGALVVLAPRGHVEWGGTDPQVNWVAPFESATGCKVNYRPFAYDPAADQSEALDPEAFDVLAAPPDLAGRMAAEQRVAVIDTRRVEGYHDIPKRLRDAAGGHAVPYLWDRNALLYDSDKVSPRDAEAAYGDEGPVLIRDTPLSIADAALRQGAEDPFALTPEQLDAAVELLAREGERVYWRDPLRVVSGFAAGTARYGQGTPYLLNALERAGKPVGAVAEKRVTGWQDAWQVSAEAAHPECAYQWLSWVTSVETQRKAAAWTGMAPANAEVCEEAAPEEVEASVRERAERVCGLYGVGTSQAFKGVSFADYPTKDCPGEDGECTDYAQWVDRWKQLVN